MSILLSTTSDTPMADSTGIQDYFDTFFLKQLQGKFLEGTICIGNGCVRTPGKQHAMLMVSISFDIAFITDEYESLTTYYCLPLL